MKVCEKKKLLRVINENENEIHKNNEERNNKKNRLIII